MHSKLDIPQGHYVGNIEVNHDSISVDLKEKKKVALLFISLNDIYWPYLAQCIKDCRQNFLPHHDVDYFVWSDYNDEEKKKKLGMLEGIYRTILSLPPEQKQGPVNQLLEVFSSTIRLFEVFYPQQVIASAEVLKAQGILFRRDAMKFWVESTHPVTDADITLIYETTRHLLLLSHSDMDSALKGVTVTETAPVAWPAPTLMRYHLFLNLEEKLKEYDYIFYMDADMRIVSKVSDEILGDGLTAAEHPMYSLRKEYIPPYEPNPNSTAYIKRPGKLVVDEKGQTRFKPLYYAGGFQGGTSESFLKAMQVMKDNTDRDFDNNYTAIWNDESHWNKHLSEHDPAVVLSPSYIYPDSLIKEYYEKIWGRSYEPKIITLTKPFSLSAQGAEEINKFIKQ